MNLAELEANYPAIRWREPLKVAWVGGDEMFACRVCIANQGLKKKSTWQWPKLEQAEAHIHWEHGVKQ